MTSGSRAYLTSDKQLATSIWAAALADGGEESFLDAALAAIQSATGAHFLALVRGRKAKWQVLRAAGRSKDLPVDLMSSCLDAESLRQVDGWCAVPVDMRPGSAELLVGFTPARSAAWAALMQQAAESLRQALQLERRQLQSQQRIERLEAILEIAAQWNRAQKTDELLRQMAETSTRLLAAERASVFLWDRRSKTLVGRPALGVEGGELRIADDKGVVGQVVQAGEPRRVDADDRAEQQEINRAVDRQLKFQTRSLLCVPLRGRGGELFGAFEVINKLQGNFTDEDQDALTELATHAAIALENAQQREKLLKLRDGMVDSAAEQIQMIGQCAAVEALRSTVRRVADTDLAILILGEHGTGKEVVAQMIHYLSGRRTEPLVAVNCAAVAETLLESELFGHEKGAFTDAHESRPGKFELAAGGTLFLDEIAEMSPSGQAKLLRVLEEKVVTRVGGSKLIHTDARVIAATNRDLADMVRQRKFRADLFFRLNVLTLELPPLREREDDVLMLSGHFLEAFCAKAGRKPPRFTAAARKRLLDHNWPGNIRELRNLMERLAYLTQGDKIDADDLAFVLPREEESSGLLSLDLPLAEATREFQIQYIHRQISRARGSMTAAAQRLGLHRSNLYRKMRQLKMPAEQEGVGEE